MKTVTKTRLVAIFILALSCKKESNAIESRDINNKSSVSDVNNLTGKYASIRIGTQKWMTKNLDETNYRNGDKIPQVKDLTKWAFLTTGAWCWYENDSAHYAIYGRLYNWYAVNDPRGLAPQGWHVPTDAEWDTLTVRLGNNAGGKLKDTGTLNAGTGLWSFPNEAPLIKLVSQHSQGDIVSPTGHSLT